MWDYFDPGFHKCFLREKLSEPQSTERPTLSELIDLFSATKLSANDFDNWLIVLSLFFFLL